MHLSQGAELQRQRELYFPASGINFSFSSDVFFFITQTFFLPGIQTLLSLFHPTN